VDEATKRTVRRGLLQAWESGDAYLQYAALQFIIESRPPQGRAVVGRALTSKHPSMVGNALSAALLYTVHRQKLGKPLKEALERVVEHGMLGSERWTALTALGRAGAGRNAWLEELLERSPFECVRMEAARLLTERGSALGKELLLGDVRAHREHYGVAHELWAYRAMLGLSDAERREVRKVVTRYLRSLRRRLHGKASDESERRMAAGVLRELAADGFKLTSNDLKAIRKVQRRR
jgi:hypothetical protein